MKRRRESGLTLIEVMVVIAIIGIVSAVAVPAVLNWLPDYRVKRAARELYGNLQRAKMAAVRECRRCDIIFQQAPAEYAVRLDSNNDELDNDGDGDVDEPDERRTIHMINLAAYGSGIKFDGPAGQTFPGGGFVFDARGLCTVPTALPDYAYLTNSRETLFYRVGTSTAGGIRMERYNPHAPAGSEWN